MACGKVPKGPMVWDDRNSHIRTIGTANFDARLHVECRRCACWRRAAPPSAARRPRPLPTFQVRAHAAITMEDLSRRSETWRQSTGLSRALARLRPSTKFPSMESHSLLIRRPKFASRPKSRNAGSPVQESRWQFRHRSRHDLRRRSRPAKNPCAAGDSRDHRSCLYLALRPVYDLWQICLCPELDQASLGRSSARIFPRRSGDFPLGRTLFSDRPGSP